MLGAAEHVPDVATTNSNTSSCATFFQDTNDYDYNQFRLKENVLIFEISIAVIIIFIGRKTLVVSGNIIIKFVMGLEMIYYRPLNDIL